MRVRFFLGAVLLLGCSQPPAAPAADAGLQDLEDRAAAPDAPQDAAPDASADAPADGRAPSRPFSQGPYGVRPRDLAGPFTVTTPEGPWSFQDSWTGEDSYVFLVVTTSSYSTNLLRGSLAGMLERSPRNVHYFFLQSGAASALEALRARFGTELGDLPEADREHWGPRLHYVPDDVTTQMNWLGDLVRARRRTANMVPRYESVQWAVDRAQRVREVGQLGRLASGGLRLELSFLGNEARYYNFEFEREERLRRERGTTVVELLRNETVIQDAYPEVMLPSAEAMATFDTLEVDLTTDCVNHRDGDCGAWDYLSHLWLCEAPAGPGGGADAGAPDGMVPPPRCPTELARWITTYWREGRWVTDISGVLPLLREGGRQRFRWYASRQFDPRPASYIASLSLRFSNRGRGMRPVEARRVYEGGALNADYNARHPPVRFTVPDGTRRVELYTLVTGHGAETRQCAEFCNHTHHLRVNGTDHPITFPEAQTQDGCTDRVDQGVVPNQHGTWYFGRGGWCPGWDVRPHLADITADLRPGMENELTYEALIGTARPAPMTGYGNVVLTTYLVFWR
ncbi:MAG: hypothetical protein HY909_04255 [Deltaproteobacteria bacterium]|nr:hypothetical protein [Deltaproteobacteria bacterium]